MCGETLLLMAGKEEGKGEPGQAEGRTEGAGRRIIHANVLIIQKILSKY